MESSNACLISVTYRKHEDFLQMIDEESSWIYWYQFTGLKPEGVLYWEKSAAVVLAAAAAAGEG